ncbi:MAG TPA: S8 family serine peptidase [Mycobacteriales bacterium]|nr:S8 family serine peptidase [Mycobacteriales bacterium]
MHRVKWAIAAAAIGAVAPLVISGGAAAAAGPARAPMVRAVVEVRPGTSLPLAVPGGRVLDSLPAVGAEYVAASATGLAQLSRDRDVLSVSPNWTGHVMGLGRRGRGGDNGPDQQGVFGPQAVGGDAGNSHTGAGVTVALLDTGVNDSPALSRASGRLIDGVDVSHLAATGFASMTGPFTDGYGHGTFLASLIAGGQVPGSNGAAIGIAPAAHVVAVKVADSTGQTNLLQVLAGLDWVATHARSIQIVNLSLGIDRPTAPAYGPDPLTAAVEAVRAAGVLVVVAAGNTPGQVGDPGLDPRALTVGAANVEGRSAQIAPFSGSGVVDGVAKPDVVAPGMHVLGEMTPNTMIAEQNPQAWTRRGLFLGSGTSEATAITSGVAAAYLSDHRGSSPLQVKTAIRGSAQPVEDRRAGAGLVSLARDRYGNFGWHHRLADPTGEASFNERQWQANSWLRGAWVSLFASSWSASSWSASSWSASSWSGSSWFASSWSASSWSASSWSDAGWGPLG